MAGFCRKFKGTQKKIKAFCNSTSQRQPMWTFWSTGCISLEGRCARVCVHTHIHILLKPVCMCVYTHMGAPSHTCISLFFSFLGCAQHCQIYKRGCGKERQRHTCAREAGTRCHLDLWRCWNSLDTAIEPELCLNILLFQPPHNHHLMFMAPGSPWILKSTHAAVSYIK